MFKHKNSYVLTLLAVYNYNTKMSLQIQEQNSKTIRLKIATRIQCGIRFCFAEIKLPLAMWVKNQLLEDWLLEFAVPLIILCCVMIQFSLILSLSELLRDFHLQCDMTPCVLHLVGRII